MCIRDSAYTGGEAMGEDTFLFFRALGVNLKPVSYTHLDVYKRQALNAPIDRPHYGVFRM